MYYKVVYREDDRYVSSDVVGLAQTEYIPDVEVRPEYGPSFCFKTEQQALHYLGASDLERELWECVGEVSRQQPASMLLYGHTHSGTAVETFWHCVRCGGSIKEDLRLGLDRLFEGTVFLDTVKLVQCVHKGANDSD